jgi:aspartate/methionine/tyrosine aminotransferase
LPKDKFLKIDDPQVKTLLEGWLQEDSKIEPDKKFVYNLLAAQGVCVVPISSFCSKLQGFRVTLLENDEALLVETFSRIRRAVEDYCI